MWCVCLEKRVNLNIKKIQHHKDAQRRKQPDRKKRKGTTGLAGYTMRGMSLYISPNIT